MLGSVDSKAWNQSVLKPVSYPKDPQTINTYLDIQSNDIKRCIEYQIYQFPSIIFIMIAEPTYDSFCVNPLCIQNLRSFFNYDDESLHVKEHLECIRVIHPREMATIASPLMKKQKSIFDQSKRFLDDKVDTYIDTFCQKMCTFMKKTYLNGYSELAKNQLDQFKLNDVSEVCSKLKGGSYEMLNDILNALGKNQLEEQTKSVIQKKIDDIDKGLEKSLQNLYQNFEKIFTVTFDNRQDFSKVAFGNGNFDEMSRETVEEIRRMLPNSRVDEYSSQNNIRMDKSISQRISDSSEDKQFQRRQVKRKIIQKTQGLKKNVSKGLQSSKEYSQNGPFKVSLSVAQCLSQIGPDELRVNICNNAEETYEYITSRYKNLKGIHIFHHRFATKQMLRKIFLRYPNLKDITLNCRHEFQFSLLAEFPKDSLAKIENLELKWDLDRFFTDFHINRHFPTKRRQCIERLGRVSIPVKILQELKSNRSLMLTSEKSVDYLTQSSYSFENIQSLHYMKASQDQKLPTMNKLYQICQMKLTNLIALDLSEVSLIDNEWQFRQFIKKNPNLTAINIYYCNIKQKSLGNLFQSLQILQNLTKIYYAWKSNNNENLCELRPSWILSHRRMEQLCLVNVLLIGNEDSYGDPDMSMLSGLKKLTDFALNNCFPVHSAFMKNFTPQILSQLQSLNLGITDVDDQFMKYFPSMTNLKYLDLDQTEVTGGAFLEACKQFYRQNSVYPPLKYLNIEHEIKASKSNSSRPWNFSIEEMKELSKYLPNLSYLEITNCKNLSYYNFAEFKGLKTIAMDSQLYKNMKNINPTVQKFVLDVQSSH